MLALFIFLNMPELTPRRFPIGIKAALGNHYRDRRPIRNALAPGRRNHRDGCSHRVGDRDCGLLRCAGSRLHIV